MRHSCCSTRFGHIPVENRGVEKKMPKKTYVELLFQAGSDYFLQKILQVLGHAGGQEFRVPLTLPWHFFMFLGAAMAAWFNLKPGDEAVALSIRFSTWEAFTTFGEKD